MYPNITGGEKMTPLWQSGALFFYELMLKRTVSVTNAWVGFSASIIQSDNAPQWRTCRGHCGPQLPISQTRHSFRMSFRHFTLCWVGWISPGRLWNGGTTVFNTDWPSYLLSVKMIPALHWQFKHRGPSEEHLCYWSSSNYWAKMSSSPVVLLKKFWLIPIHDSLMWSFKSPAAVGCCTLTVTWSYHRAFPSAAVRLWNKPCSSKPH